tara:strand:+ start:52949 stop:54058 length:1110 start_codon:yes stop_codon:yes gene_type:complete
MAFLDNSGDIILDAVLTDTGRLRLAQGDGSFKVTRFALGDDEINYGLYNKDHASGSAYYDLEVLQTPILEAFTNNAASLKTRLMSISRTNILFMPILKLNKNDVDSDTVGQNGYSKTFQREDKDVAGAVTSAKSDPKFYIAVDQDTFGALLYYRTSGAAPDNSYGPGEVKLRGVIQGYNAGADQRKDLVRIDQGLDTDQIAALLGLDSDLVETSFIIEMDYRLGRLKPVANDQVAPVNFIDDDNIATYYVTSADYVNTVRAPADANNAGSKKQEDLVSTDPQVFKGPRGSTVQFRIQASQELNSSTYLFTQLGSSEDADAANNLFGFLTGGNDKLVDGKTTYYLDTTIRVIGANTGFRLDIPVRYVKIA